MCFLGAFLTAQTIGLLLVLSKTQGEVVAPISFEWVGRILKEDFPAYRAMTEEEVGREVYATEPALWAEYVRIYQERYRVDPVIMHRVYSDLQRVQFCIVVFLSITIFFEVLRRAFYYVIFGQLFPRKRRRHRRNNGLPDGP